MNRHRIQERERILPNLRRLGAAILCIAMLVSTMRVSRSADFNACDVLTPAEWEALLGKAYYGPESKAFGAAAGAINSQCTYNFTEVIVRQPVKLASASSLADDLDSYLQDMAGADAENGQEWTVHVEPVEGMSVPAVAGWVTAADGSPAAGIEMYYVSVLADSNTQIRVASGESVEEARKVAEVFADKL